MTLVSRKAVSFLVSGLDPSLVIRFGDRAPRNGFASWRLAMVSFVIINSISPPIDSRECF